MRTKIYLHGNKESNYSEGEKLGLTGEALRMFTFACYEVAIEIEVNPDGTYEMLTVDGRKLEPRS
jgi:hypothetical protein